MRRGLPALSEPLAQAGDALRREPARAGLAVAGVVIGVVTVVFVASLLAGLRSQVALLFREFGTDNVFAYHRTGDPYQPPSEEEARRRPLQPAFAAPLATGPHVRDVAVQVIVPSVIGDRVLTARAGGNESDRVLVEGVSSNHFDVTGAELAAGRPFSELEDRQAARVCVLGANLVRALFGGGAAVGREVLLGGERFTVVGQAAPRRGGFFGENRQDNVMAIPQGTAARLFPEAEETVLYIRGQPGQRELARREAQGLLRQLRGLRPGQPDDFHLSTADQIIAQFDRLSALIGLATVGLAAVSLVIGGLGIANVMIIGVTERTREIGLRLALGARRREVRLQFLVESALLSLAGGAAGIALAFLLGVLLGLAVPGLVATPPLWIVAAGALAAMATGLLAGYWPAQQASALDPVEALRHE